jgi:hypothetical protein
MIRREVRADELGATVAPLIVPVAFATSSAHPADPERAGNNAHLLTADVLRYIVNVREQS